MFGMKISYSFGNIAKYILLSEEVNQSDVSYCGIKTAQVFLHFIIKKQCLLCKYTK